jgi:hypothetical protein
MILADLPVAVLIVFHEFDLREPLGALPSAR